MFVNCEGPPNEGYVVHNSSLSGQSSLWVLFSEAHWDRRGGLNCNSILVAKVSCSIMHDAEKEKAILSTNIAKTRNLI